jgi:hypothetical protein
MSRRCVPWSRSIPSPISPRSTPSIKASAAAAALGLLVIVHLLDRAGLEAHVDGGDLAGAGQIADRRLPRPAAFAQVIVAVGEGPPEVGTVPS